VVVFHGGRYFAFLQPTLLLISSTRDVKMTNPASLSIVCNANRCLMRTYYNEGGNL
jgi:hypothetical protein